MRRILFLLTCCLSGSLLTTAANAQHATAFDVEDGKVIYGRLCANCHGPDGNLIANIDLGRGLYRRDYSDGELTEIILQGIAGTPMPPNPSMSREQAEEVVSYLRERALTRSAVAANGNAARGRTLYEGKGDCASCHRINGVGSKLGPELGNIGALRTSEELMTSLLDPDAEIQPANRFYRVITRAGETVSGRLLNHDTFTVQILDEQERLRLFEKDGLREHGFISPGMPSVEGTLNEQEIADLVTWLATLRN